VTSSPGQQGEAVAGQAEEPPRRIFPCMTYLTLERAKICNRNETKAPGR
jgi:hypothetical protein